MKVFGGGSGTGKGARLPDELRRDALRYALGLPNVSVVVVGMFDQAEAKQNVQWLRDYKPLGEERLRELEPTTKKLAREWGELYGPKA